MLEEMRKQARESWIPVILDDSLEYVENLLKGRKVERVLEVGTAMGYSSINFSKFLNEDGKIDTIEVDKQMVMLSRANIEMSGLTDKINVIEGDAINVLPSLVYKYDFIFIDGPKSHYIEYLPICLNLLNDDGIIIADNVTYKGMVLGNYTAHKQRTAVNRLREFIDTVKNDESLESELLEIGDGLLLIRRKK